VPENCDQGIFFNGSAKKRIDAVFIAVVIRSWTCQLPPLEWEAGFRLRLHVTALSRVRDLGYDCTCALLSPDEIFNGKLMKAGWSRMLQVAWFITVFLLPRPCFVWA